MKILLPIVLATTVFTSGLRAGTSTFTPDADTFLFNQAPDTPQGGATTLLSYNGSDGTFAYFPLFHFDLTSLAGQTVTGDATFTVYAQGGDSNSHTIYLVNLPEAFDEATSTFNNYNPSAPTNGTKIGTDIISGTASTFGPAVGFVSITIPQATIQSWIDGPIHNFGVGIYQQTTASTDVNFASKENSDGTHHPSLTVTSVPEPAHTAIFVAILLSGVIAMRVRSRKLVS